MEAKADAANVLAGNTDDLTRLRREEGNKRKKGGDEDLDLRKDAFEILDVSRRSERNIR